MVDVIIVAAGSGKRMKADSNKQFLKINNKEIIAWTIEKFYNNKNIDNITIAIRKEDEQAMKDLIAQYGFENIQLVYGGKERQDSIYNCLNKIIHTDYVLIHDGARPFIEEETINRCIEETKLHQACCVGVPSKDTIKLVDKFGNISATPDRNKLWYAQTPQAFHIDLIKKAYSYARENGFLATDDASLVEKLGYPVKMLMGSYNNIKITTPEDLLLAKLLAKDLLLP